MSLGKCESEAQLFLVNTLSDTLVKEQRKKMNMAP